MNDRRSVRVLISGRVQGVGYRDWTLAAARGLGLSGWVRNRRDGRVEALFAGAGDVVARMLDACREGPPAARVDAVTVAEEPATAASDPAPDFRRLPTS